LTSFDVITTDANKQFVTKEFKQYVENINIKVKTVFVETHYLIEMIKQYHKSLRRIYSIIVTEIFDTNLELVLQMSFKILNNSIKFDDLIFTLLIFDAYF
jgi:ribosomal protein L4